MKSYVVLGELIDPPVEATSPEIFSQVENREKTLAKFWFPGAVHPPASIWAPAHWDLLRTSTTPHGLKQRGGPQEKFGPQPLRVTLLPQGGTLGTFWTAWSPCLHAGSHWGWVGTLLFHPYLPTHLDLVLHHPLTPRLPMRGVSTTGGRGAASDVAPGHGPCGPRSFGFHSPRLCSGLARRGSGWGQRSSSPPFPVHSGRKGRDNLPPAPPLCMWGGSGWVPPSHLGGIHPSKM